MLVNKVVIGLALLFCLKRNSSNDLSWSRVLSLQVSIELSNIAFLRLPSLSSVLQFNDIMLSSFLLIKALTGILSNHDILVVYCVASSFCVRNSQRVETPINLYQDFVLFMFILTIYGPMAWLCGAFVLILLLECHHCVWSSLVKQEDSLGNGNRIDNFFINSPSAFIKLAVRNFKLKVSQKEQLNLK
jgi:hypothetical protein